MVHSQNHSPTANSCRRSQRNSWADAAVLRGGPAELNVRLVMAVGIALFVSFADTAGGGEPGMVATLTAGAQIFHHTWKPGQPASPGGDGLGPVHNDVSCIACHHLGGVGGGGGVEKNVTLLSLAAKKPGMSRRIFHKLAAKLHPALLQQDGSLKNTIVLHKFSTDVNYTASRQRFVGLEMPLAVSDAGRPLAEKQVANLPIRPVQHASGVAFRLSQRNSPALFGAGLIDAIPDHVLHQLQKRQQKRGIVSGRVSPVNGQVGKFGWKGQTASLTDFVRDACANELGLQVPGRDQAVHPMHLDYEPAGLDLNLQQLQALTAFVATLPPPRLQTPDDKHVAETARLGRKMFEQVGCGECHVENLATSSAGIHGIFSDLLLHDMGPTLADPVPANPLTVTIEVQMPSTAAEGGSNRRTRPSSRPASSGGDSYGGGGGGGGGGSFGPLASRPGRPGTRTIELDRIVPTNRLQEWRTPPLWGVSQSAPYLHDGRASTLTQAILYHGGEAKFSVKRFLSLRPRDRLAVIEFLNSLQPPAATEL